MGTGIGAKIPYSRVFDGEKLYFMKKNIAKISATATVKLVQNHVKLSAQAFHIIMINRNFRRYCYGNVESVAWLS